MRPYQKLDYPELVYWLAQRGMEAPRAMDLPMYGIIVPEIAVGFLIITDTAYALLDFFITNPEASSIKRGRAINSIITNLIEQAQALGFTHVKCDSQINTIKRKAKTFGFRDMGNYSVFCKEI